MRSQLTPLSRLLPAPTAYARLQPNLPTAGLQQPRAPPKSMVYTREYRQEDGLLTVLLAHAVELVGIRDGVVTPSRPS